VTARLPRVAVIFNPATRNKRWPGRRSETRAALHRAGLKPLWFETSVQDPGEESARAALEQGAELLLVSGGDGTVMACAGALAGSEVPMGLLPAGTGNLLAANFDLPKGLDDALAVALWGARRRIDVGRTEEGCFVIMAGMGFDAAMLRDASPALKARVGALAYVVSALKHLRRPPTRVEVTIDDTKTVSCDAQLVLIGNLGTLQGGLVALPDAHPDDGLLDVGVVTAGSVSAWLRLGFRLLRGRVASDPRVRILRGKRIEVQSARPLPVELDGDVFEETTNLTVEVVPSCLILCVPEQSLRPMRRSA
jgi:YegS/Rv2252/BmrU family lipid kinase